MALVTKLPHDDITDGSRALVALFIDGIADAVHLDLRDGGWMRLELISEAQS